MNKFNIVKKLAKEKNLTESDSLAVLTTIVDEIGQALYVGERAEFRGFGVFFTKVREKRYARNPRTGERIKVNKKKLPQFKMAKSFYELINK